MRERPILFNGPMVRAILAGQKTQTRRVIKPQPKRTPALGGFGRLWFDGNEDMNCPFGVRGDRLWVRETWMPGYYHEADHEDGPKVSVIYRADHAELTQLAPSVELAEQWERDFSDDGDDAPPARPSIHMPRWACRLVLEITAVRVERLHGISEANALAEGIQELNGRFTFNEGMHESLTPRLSFQTLWDSTGGDWASNPWVWVIEFKVVTHG